MRLGLTPSERTWRAVEVLRRDAASLTEIRAGIASLEEPPPAALTGAERAALEAAHAALMRAVVAEEEIRATLAALEGKIMPVTEADAAATLGAVVDGARLPKRTIMRALRIALIGREHGLPVAAILWILGTDEARRRLARALATSAAPAPTSTEAS